MAFVRSIGRWTMTALVINTIIGSGIFGLPGELNRLLGRASPFAMIFAALGVAVIMACVAEVASQFSEPGGPYLYVRTAFGRFLGMQIGWLELLSVVTGLAALTNLFVDYLAAFLPRPLIAWERASLMAVVIAIPAVVNYRGARGGGRLSNLTTLAKLTPLALLILVGLVRFARQPQMIRPLEITSPGISNWIRAIVLLLFAYGGWEDTLVPAGEINEPRRTIPFGLGTALFTSAVIYMLLQFITVATIGTKATATPLQEVAAVLLARGGATFVTIAALVSVYGWISGAMLYAPRLTYSLAAQGDFPAMFTRIHPRFHTPAVAILFYALVGWVLAASGTFLYLVAVGSATFLVLYTGMCASLIRLRKLHPNAKAFRIPFGPVVSVFGVAISLALMTGLKRREVFLLCVTALIAAANWMWAKRRQLQGESNAKTRGNQISAG
jgi:amino acid transporter